MSLILHVLINKKIKACVCACVCYVPPPGKIKINMLKSKDFNKVPVSIIKVVTVVLVSPSVGILKIVVFGLSYQRNLNVRICQSL